MGADMIASLASVLVSRLMFNLREPKEHSDEGSSDHANLPTFSISTRFSSELPRFVYLWVLRDKGLRSDFALQTTSDYSDRRPRQVSLCFSDLWTCVAKPEQQEIGTGLIMRSVVM